METKDFDKNTQLKLFLLDKFGIADDLKTIDFCERAYKFLMQGDMMVYKGLDEKGNVLVERMPPVVSGKPKEFIRADAFMKKAENFLEMLGYGFTITDNITHKNYDKEQLIEDFRNYMKGE